MKNERSTNENSPFHKAQYPNALIQVKSSELDLILPVPTQSEVKSTNITQAVKELPLVFWGRGEVKGRQFTQIKCSCRAYLYEVKSCGITYWEVFHRRQNQQYGNITYPSSNAFGKWAWTFISLNKAVERFEKLNLIGGI